MSLIKTLSKLVGGKDESEPLLDNAEQSREFTPKILDSPPDYTFVNALLAARQGDMETVSKYLAFNNGYARCRNWEGCTMLHQAVKQGRAAVSEVLLNHQADANADYKGETPLFIAIAGDALEIAKMSPTDFLDYRKRRRETLRVLLKHGASLHLMNDGGERPLHIAARLGYSELVDILLAHGVDVNQAISLIRDEAYLGNQGCTPLLLATRDSKDLKTVRLLLEKGADPNVQDSDPGYTPLHYIAAWQQDQYSKLKASTLRELTQLLLEKGADLQRKTADKLQRTALHLAVANGHTGIVDVLLANGADLHTTDATGLMVLGLAARRGDAAMVTYLLDKGADMQLSRALFNAAACRSSDAVLKLLLRGGADLNMPDTDGYTPLFAAISIHSLRNARLLIEHGADTSMHSPSGLTVLEHAFACWGEVESVADDLTEEQQQIAADAKEIVSILGGFDKKSRQHII